MVLLIASNGRIVNYCAIILESDNYPYWREIMNTYIISINERAWCSVPTGWQPSMVEFESGKVPKFELKWTIEEERVANSNSKELYVIFCGITL